MKTLVIATKTLKEAFRQPKNLAITLGLPLAFMLIFGLAFGGAQASTYDLAVVDHDGTDLSRAFLDGIREMEYASGTPLFGIANVSEEEARTGLERGDYDAVLIVPAGFAEDATPQGEPPEGGLPLTQPQGAPPTAEGAIVQVLGDPSRVGFQASSQAISAYSAAFAESVSGQRAAVSAQTSPATSAELTPFDYIAPGLMVFAILNIIPQSAAMLARESETRTIDRVRMSPTNSLSLLGGVALAQLALASVSLALMLVTARLMGFHNQGSYWEAYVIAIGAAVSATGIGLMVASFARTQQEAGNFGALVSVPASFLSGAFFVIPGVALFGGFELYDVIPTTHAVDALRQVMTFGRDLADVTSMLAALAGLGLFYFAVGAVLYRRTRLRAD